MNWYDLKPGDSFTRNGVYDEVWTVVDKEVFQSPGDGPAELVRYTLLKHKNSRRVQVTFAYDRSMPDYYHVYEGS